MVMLHQLIHHWRDGRILGAVDLMRGLLHRHRRDGRPRVGVHLLWSHPDGHHREATAARAVRQMMRRGHVRGGRRLGTARDGYAALARQNRVGVDDDEGRLLFAALHVLAAGRYLDQSLRVVYHDGLAATVTAARTETAGFDRRFLRILLVLAAVDLGEGILRLDLLDVRAVVHGYRVLLFWVVRWREKEQGVFVLIS